jgi:hypothetical protein
MEQLKWSFGSLSPSQESDFIFRRLDMMDKKAIPPALLMALTALAASSQETVRRLAVDHLHTRGFQGAQIDDDDLKQRAASVVSLRDIQRLFSLFGFFKDNFHVFHSSKQPGPPIAELRKAMILAVAIVYYMRLDAAGRLKLLQTIKSLPNEQLEADSFEKVLEDTMHTVITDTFVPPGIAITQGLKENLFVTLVCSLSRTPLMIVGPPGSSKVSRFISLYPKRMGLAI